jgi:hypothetical protein
VYRRDEKGNIVKKADHLMDAMRYFVVSGRDIARTKPMENKPSYGGLQQNHTNWMT